MIDDYMIDFSDIDYSDILVMLDNGHGSNTPGKCSVDKKLKEYKYCRETVAGIAAKLKVLGIPYCLVTPEEYDVPLATRVNRINKEYARCKAKGIKCLMISVHNNAAGNGKVWMTGTGWECWTTVGQNNSDKLATCLYEAAKEEKGMNGKSVILRTDKKDGDPDKEKNWYIIKNANCVSVLTENFFMDNKKECEWLLSDIGRTTVINIHVNGILKYIKQLKSKAA